MIPDALGDCGLSVGDDSGETLFGLDITREYFVSPFADSGVIGSWAGCSP